MRIPILMSASLAAFAVHASEPPLPQARAAKSWPQGQTVNLDRPGVLEAIEREDPDRHRRILALIEAAKSPTCDHLPQVMKIELNVSAYSCSSAMFLTSHPAKRRLTFAMD